MEYCDVRSVICSSDHEIFLLVGNGLSIKFHSGFSYPSLQFKAYGTNQLSTENQFFQLFGTTNFEEVLRGLRNTVEAARLSGYENEQLTINVATWYKKIRQDFITTLHQIHPERTQVTSGISKICSELKNFARVFSTNYDLLIYWVINSNDLAKATFTDRLVKK